MAEWQCTSLFGAPDPDLLSTSFVDEETNRLLNEQSSFGERTLTPSPPPTPKPKGKARKVEHNHQDLMSDDIYEEEKSPGLSRPKLTLNTGKGQDNLAISAAGLSGSPVSNLSGPSQRLAAIKEVLQAICHKPHPSLSCLSLKLTTTEPHSTVKEHTCTKLSLPTMSNTIKKTEETEPENLGYSLNYPKFYNVTDGEEYLNQLV